MFMRGKSESEMLQIWGRKGVTGTPPGPWESRAEQTSLEVGSSHPGVAEASPVGPLVMGGSAGTSPRGLR